MSQRKIVTTFIWLSLGFAAHLPAFDIGTRVGRWSDPDRLQVTGCTSFRAETIKRSLCRDVPVFRAGHPTGLLVEYQRTLQQRAVLGYQHVGFPEALVAVSPNNQTEKIELVVQEGPRYLAGDVRIECPEATLSSLLAKRLTDHRPPANATADELSDDGHVLRWVDASGDEVETEAPLWVSGKPAPFDAPSHLKMRKRIEEQLADLGYPNADFESEVATEANTGIWRITIQDLGGRAVLNEIEIAGNTHNSDKEVIEYLGLKKGAPFTRSTREGIELALWESGRFIQQRIVTTNLPDRRGTRLRIELTEFGKAPRLSEPFSREAKAMLMHRQWLIHGEGAKRDIVVSMTTRGRRLETVISPRLGILARLWKETDGQGKASAALIASDEVVGCYAIGNRKKLDLPTGNVQLNGQLKVFVSEDDDNKPRKLMLGLGFSSLEPDEARAPLVLTTSLAPVYFVAQAAESDTTSWDGDILTLVGKDNTTRINARTGELIEQRFESSNDETMSGHVVCETGAFLARRQEVLDDAQGHFDVFDPERPIGSVLSFFLQTQFVEDWAGFIGIEHHPLLAPDLMLAFGKLVDGGLFDPVDEEVRKHAFEGDDEEFALPHQPDPASKTWHTGVAYLSAMLANELFPRDTWAWTMWREGSLAIAGQQQHAMRELQRLVIEDRCGPTGYWALAELIAWGKKSPATIVSIASMKLDVDRFRAEWNEALRPEFKAALAKSLNALPLLSSQEAAMLGQVLFRDPEAIDGLVTELRKREHSTEEAVNVLLDQLWHRSVHGLLGDRLDKLKEMHAPKQVSKKPARID